MLVGQHEFLIHQKDHSQQQGENLVLRTDVYIQLIMVSGRPDGHLLDPERSEGPINDPEGLLSMGGVRINNGFCRCSWPHARRLQRPS